MLSRSFRRHRSTVICALAALVVVTASSTAAAEPQRLIFQGENCLVRLNGVVWGQGIPSTSPDPAITPYGETVVWRLRRETISPSGKHHSFYQQVVLPGSRLGDELPAEYLEDGIVVAGTGVGVHFQANLTPWAVFGKQVHDAALEEFPAIVQPSDAFLLAQEALLASRDDMQSWENWSPEQQAEAIPGTRAHLELSSRNGLRLVWEVPAFDLDGRGWLAMLDAATGDLLRVIALFSNAVPCPPQPLPGPPDPWTEAVAYAENTELGSPRAFDSNIEGPMHATKCEHGVWPNEYDSWTYQAFRGGTRSVEIYQYQSNLGAAACLNRNSTPVPLTTITINGVVYPVFEDWTVTEPTSFSVRGRSAGDAFLNTSRYIDLLASSGYGLAQGLCSVSSDPACDPVTAVLLNYPGPYDYAMWSWGNNSTPHDPLVVVSATTSVAGRAHASASLDVMSHELTHGLLYKSDGTAWFNETGTTGGLQLGEGLADIGGIASEWHYHAEPSNPDVGGYEKADWLFGEDHLTHGPWVVPTFWRRFDQYLEKLDNLYYSNRPQYFSYHKNHVINPAVIPDCSPDPNSGNCLQNMSYTYERRLPEAFRLAALGDRNVICDQSISSTVCPTCPATSLGSNGLWQEDCTSSVVGLKSLFGANATDRDGVEAAGQVFFDGLRSHVPLSAEPGWDDFATGMSLAGADWAEAKYSGATPDCPKLLAAKDAVTDAFRAIGYEPTTTLQACAGCAYTTITVTLPPGVANDLPTPFSNAPVRVTPHFQKALNPGDGTIVFQVPSNDTYTVTPEAPNGYTFGRTGSSAPHPGSWTGWVGTSPVAVTFHAEYKVSGTLKLSTGVAIVGQPVNLMQGSGPDPVGSGTSLPDGTFAIPKVDAGTYTLVAGGCYSSTPVGVTAPAVNSNFGNPTADVIASPRLNTVSGTVRLNGVGRAGVVVSLDATKQTTNSLGQFTFQNVQPGNYVLSPLPADNGGNTFTSEVTLEDHIHVEVCSTPVGGNNFNFETHTVSGTLSSGFADISGVVVQAKLGGTELIGTSMATGSSGAYTINGLIHGTYTVTPVKDRYCFSSLPQFQLSGDVGGKNFTVVGHTISGTATYDAGGGIGGVHLTCQVGGTSCGSYDTLPDGSYSFTNLLDGQYAIAASKGTASITNPQNGIVTIACNDQVANFTGQTYTLSGAVTTNGNPVVGATVTATGVNINETRSTTTTATGSYSLALLPGQYNIEPSQTGYCFGPASVQQTVSGNVSGVNFNRSKTSFIQGSITQQGGAPLAALVSCWNNTEGASCGTRNADISYGWYGFGQMAIGNSYTITPSRSGKPAWTFTPTNLTFTLTCAGQWADFAGAQ